MSSPTRSARPSPTSYRYGGEELLVLLAEQRLEGASIVCERMREAVHARGLLHADNEPGVVTISIGAAAYPQGSHTDPTDADRAVYAAKAQGQQASHRRPGTARLGDRRSRQCDPALAGEAGRPGIG